MFAPKPRDYSYVLNKKVKRLAMKSALSAKAAAGEIIVIDSIKMDSIKTKDFRAFLNAVGPTASLWWSPPPKTTRSSSRAPATSPAS